MLGDSKRDLVHGRLGRRLRVLGCSSFTDYLDLLDGPDAEQEQSILINAITTNLTAFFREAAPLRGAREGRDPGARRIAFPGSPPAHLVGRMLLG